MEAVRPSNGCNLYEGILNGNTYCFHPYPLGRDAHQLRLNVDQAGLYVDAIGLELEELGYDGDKVGLNANAASTIAHQAWRNIDKVGLNSHACTEVIDYGDCASLPDVVVEVPSFSTGTVGRSE